VNLKGEMVARWLQRGDVERKLSLLVGGRVDDENDDAEWEITGEVAPAGFKVRRVPGGQERVFRFSALSGMPIELTPPTAEARDALMADIQDANPVEIRRAEEALRRHGHDPDRLDDASLLRLGRFAIELSAKRPPAEDDASFVYDSLKEGAMYRLGAAMFEVAHRITPSSAWLRVNAATMARHSGNVDMALHLTEPVEGRNIPGATQQQTAMLLVVRGHALVTLGRLKQAKACADRAWAIESEANPEYVRALYRAIDARTG